MGTITIYNGTWYNTSLGARAPILLSSLVTGAVAAWDSRLGISESGGTATAWADQIGGHDFAEASNGPTYNASDANWGGRPSLSFVGADTDTFLSVLAASAYTFLHDGTGGSMIVIARATADNTMTLLATCGSTATDGPGTNFRRLGTNDSFNVLLLDTADGATLNSNSGADTFEINERKVLLFSGEDGASPEAETTTGTGSTTGSIVTPDTNAPVSPLRMSGRGTSPSSDPFVGSIVSAYLFDRAKFSAGEVSTALAWALSEWNAA